MARLHHVKKFRGTTKTEDGCRTCDKCDGKIKVGDSYFYWANRLPGSRSGTLRVRCIEHRPTPSEMTPGRRGWLMAIQEAVERDVQVCGDSTDSYLEVAQTAAEEIRSIAEELRESSEAIEEGFGHATSQSEELAERADEIERQCDELEYPSIDDPPERDEFEGDDEDEDDDGEGDYEDAMADWRGAARDAVIEAVHEVDLG